MMARWPFRQRRSNPHVETAYQVIAESNKRAETTEALTRELRNGAVHGNEPMDRAFELIRRLTDRDGPSLFGDVIGRRESGHGR